MLNTTIDNFLKNILSEDIGRGDLYNRVSLDKQCTANVIAKESGILSGEIYVSRMCEIVGVEFNFTKHDTNDFEAGDIILEIVGPSNKILTIERSVLNILQHSSGIATNAKKYLDVLENKTCKILDTRKTRPLLREFEKYSVRQGGVTNHRMGLDDCLMLKDTHMATISDLKNFIKEARKNIPWTTKIEIECDTVELFQEAIESNVDIIMCDNMDIVAIKECVDIRNKFAPHILIEVSGNISLNNLNQYANLGVDAISSGSIIHQATWIDFSMKIK